MNYAAAIGIAAALSGCVPQVNDHAALPPQSVPIPPPAPSDASLKARAYYAKVQQNLLAQGLLRQDAGPRDAPFDATQLAENFMRIALHEEYAREAGQFVRRETPTILRRWDIPVQIELRFGESVSQAQRSRDLASVGAYIARLATLTNHPISLVERSGNFVVFVTNEDERRALAPAITQLVPQSGPGDLVDITAMEPTTYCAAYALSRGKTGRYRVAFAVIRAEHPDLLRMSCLQEEIAQGLGLSNDSPKARPSIFNDNEEFGLLTKHDELLLQMLYSPRLKPGMSIAQAAPIVLELAHELLPSDA